MQLQKCSVAFLVVLASKFDHHHKLYLLSYDVRRSAVARFHRYFQHNSYLYMRSIYCNTRYSSSIYGSYNHPLEITSQLKVLP